MSEKVNTLPDPLKPYPFHGVDLTYDAGAGQANGECPFCGKAKFYANSKTGLWDCKVCGRRGNTLLFLRSLWAESEKTATDADYERLRENRKLLSAETLRSWGVRKSLLTGEWLVPGYLANGKLGQLYRYAKGFDGRMILMATPALPPGLHGFNLFSEKRKAVYVCEGPWDGMAFWEVARQAKRPSHENNGRSKLAPTATEKASILTDANVVATPGANVFPDTWAAAFAGKDLYFLYDSDHPVKGKGSEKAQDPAGLAGVRRAVRTLSRAEEQPGEVSYLQWGKRGYDPELESGYDVRDCLTEQASLSGRVKRLETILSKLKPTPAEWVTGRADSGARGRADVECADCSEWRVAVTAWRKAMKWTEGLDRALSVMLASITSTMAVGDQLWVKVIGPASCLRGDTPIHDPVDGTTQTVEERCRAGKMFCVHTLLPSGEVSVADALPPEQYPAEDMYEVSFRSGRKIVVTAGHQFWDGDSYVSLRTIADALRESSAYPLPSISGTDLLSRGPGALRSSRTTQGSQCGCRAYPCSCGVRLLPGTGNGLCVVPSPSDAPTHTLPSSSEGVATPGDKRTPRRACRPSSYRESAPAQSLPYEDESSLAGGEGIYESSPNSYQTAEQFPPGKSQIGTELPSCQCDFSPKELLGQDGSLPRADSSKSEYEIDYTRESRQSTAGSDLSCTDPLPSGSELSSERSSVYAQLATPITIRDVRLGRLTLSDDVIEVKPVGRAPYYDFHVPQTNNYWAAGVFNHNCGKSTLCEAVSVNKKYVSAKSTIRGFHSGFKSDSAGSEDNSLAHQLRGKTLVTKDGDTLLQSPNLGQILAEARDLYDTTSRSHYRNKMGKDYVGLRMTWLLCGTSSLRDLDSSELGERFLDCVIMDEIDEDLEDEILWRVVNRADRSLAYESGRGVNTQHEPDMVEAMQLTGGYVTYLRENAQELLASTQTPEWAKEECIRLGKFVAYARARPSKKQDESVEREFAARLVSQIMRLAKCLAVVLNRPAIDAEVMRRVSRTAMDTARGRTLEILKALHRAGEPGMETKAVALVTKYTEEKQRVFLRFLNHIGAVENFTPTDESGKKLSHKPRWRLSKRMSSLYETILNHANARPEGD